MLSSENHPQNIPLLNPKNAQWRNISASHALNLTGMFQHYSVLLRHPTNWNYNSLGIGIGPPLQETGDAEVPGRALRPHAPGLEEGFDPRLCRHSVRGQAGAR